MRLQFRRILTAPFRVLTWPFRAVRDFLNFEPDDTPTTEVFARTLRNPSVLIEHLEALRRHVLRSLAVLAVTIGLSFAFAGRILDWLAGPVGGVRALQSIEVTESISAFMRVSLLAGFALAVPYLGFELFLFLQPGLRPRERKFVLLAIPSAGVLFLAGMAFAFFVMLPTALPFLLNFLGIPTLPRPANYIRFVTGLMFWIGVSFQFPLVVFALAWFGLVSARALAAGWRFAVLAIALLAAAVTPTVDPVNMALVMLPMIVLYFLSIGLAALAGRVRGEESLPT
ncbi:MAG: twin-arginine translocase subunit TatC [Anaerolineales bacterium]